MKITIEFSDNKIQGALARGYTYPQNEKKVLDNDLIEAMANEIKKLLIIEFDIDDIKINEEKLKTK